MTLTPRELEVLGLLRDGDGAKQIARKLDISVRTVETHEQHARAKLGARNRTHAVVLAIRQGVILPVILMTMLVSAPSDALRRPPRPPRPTASQRYQKLA